jgi:hypothetical protein
MSPRRPDPKWGVVRHRKEKEAKRKKEEREACGNCRNGGNPLGFSTVTTGPTAVNINHSSLLIVLSH